MKTSRSALILLVIPFTLVFSVASFVSCSARVRQAPAADNTPVVTDDEGSKKSAVLPYDIDNDGRVNCDDQRLIITVEMFNALPVSAQGILADPIFTKEIAAADVNKDGVVDQKDVEAFIAANPTLNCDAVAFVPYVSCYSKPLANTPILFTNLAYIGIVKAPAQPQIQDFLDINGDGKETNIDGFLMSKIIGCTCWNTTNCTVPTTTDKEKAFLDAVVASMKNCAATSDCDNDQVCVAGKCKLSNSPILNIGCLGSAPCTLNN
ncbi:MAG: hypothetical protein WCQ53_02945 [bacterium]